MQNVILLYSNQFDNVIWNSRTKNRFLLFLIWISRETKKTKKKKDIYYSFGINFTQMLTIRFR